MMRWTVAALFAVLMGTDASTQETAQQERAREQPAVPEVIRLHNADTEIIELVRQRQLRREAELERLNRCTLPDGTARGVDTTVVFNGWTYRCVEVLGSQFERIGAGWIRLPESEQDRPTR